jgi:hypothetical protein
MGLSPSRRQRGQVHVFGRRVACQTRLRAEKWTSPRRAGVASLDYVLVLGVVLPMVVFIARVGPRIIRAAYEMVCVLLSWPFM